MKTLRDTKRLVRKLALPHGGRNHTLTEGSYSWVKQGGYANELLARIYTALERELFKFQDRHVVLNDMSKNLIGRQSFWVNGPWTVSISIIYGATKRENMHKITLDYKDVM